MGMGAGIALPAPRPSLVAEEEVRDKSGLRGSFSNKTASDGGDTGSLPCSVKPRWI